MTYHIAKTPDLTRPPTFVAHTHHRIVSENHLPRKRYRHDSDLCVEYVSLAMLSSQVVDVSVRLERGEQKADRGGMFAGRV